MNFIACTIFLGHLLQISLCANETDIGFEPRTTTEAFGVEPQTAPASHESLCSQGQSRGSDSRGEFIFITEFNVSTRAFCYDLNINESSLQVCFDLSQGLECRASVYREKEFFRIVNGSSLVEGASVDSLYDYHEGRLLMCSGDCNPDVTTELVDVGEYSNKYRLYTRTVGAYVNVFCVTTYLIIFCLVPALRNAAGYNVASMTVAYFVVYVLKVIDMTPAFQPNLPHFCWTSAVVKYYFGLVTFFSMNAMSFIIYRTFKRSTEKFVSFADRKVLKHFFYYWLYSWGVPLLPAVASAVVDSRADVPPPVRPQFGKNNDCWFNTNGSKLFFVSIPVLFIMVTNAVFFVLCAIHISRSAMKRKKGDSKQTAPGIRVSVYLRLGVMLGATWLLGSVAAVLANSTNKLHFWLALDVISSMQGPVLLLVFACNKHVYRHFGCGTKGAKTSSGGTAAQNKKTTSTALTSKRASKEEVRMDMS